MDNLQSQGSIVRVFIVREQQNNRLVLHHSPPRFSASLSPPILTSATSDTNGELTFGGTDSSKYSGSITYVPVTTVSPFSLYWGINVGAIKYGSTTLLASGDSAIVDTGTTLIYLPVLAYNKFLSATGGSTDSTSGLAMFSTKPTCVICSPESIEVYFVNKDIVTAAELFPSRLVAPLSLSRQLSTSSPPLR